MKSMLDLRFVWVSLLLYSWHARAVSSTCCGRRRSSTICPSSFLMRWWLYLRLFTPLLPAVLFGMRQLGRKNLVTKLPLFHWSTPSLGDKFGESLGGSQAPPSFWEVPGLPRKFPELPRKFFSDFPGSSLTVELNSNPEVPRKFPRLPRKFPKLPRKSPDFPGGQPLSLGSLTPSFDSQKLSLIVIQLIYVRTMLFSLATSNDVSSLHTEDVLEAALDNTPLLPSSSQIVPLQLSSSSSDASPSSSVIAFNIADCDPATEDEQPKQEEGTAHEDRRS